MNYRAQSYVHGRLSMQVLLFAMIVFFSTHPSVLMIVCCQLINYNTTTTNYMQLLASHNHSITVNKRDRTREEIKRERVKQEEKGKN